MSWPYPITTRATGLVLTSAIYNSDHQNHVDNNIPTSINDYSDNAAQMQSTVDPGEVGTESLATTLAGELERLRFGIKELKDVVHGSSLAQWYTSTTPTTANPAFATLAVTGTTDSTSTTTGALKTAGGLGVVKALWVGGLANVAGAVTLQSTLAVTGITTLSSQVNFSQLTTPVTPPTGQGGIYQKTDKRWYYQTDAGQEFQFGELIAGRKALTGYLLPSIQDGWRGIYRAGFDWWSRNQQWGGPFGFELVDAATGVMYKGEAATGYIDGDASYNNLGAAAASTWVGESFILAETQTVAAIWIPLYKVGNPTNSARLYIVADDGSGKPLNTTPITNGTATAQSGKLHTSDTNGQWYRFVFATPPSCTGGTKYHIIMSSSGAVDASNYWRWMQRGATQKYPFGNATAGADGTPTSWNAYATAANLFLIELSASAQTLQSSGVFDGKLQFGGNPASGTLTMARGLCNSPQIRLGELVNPQDFTLWLVGTAWSKDATILDIGYGEDHDRIVLRSNVTTGYAQVDVYDNTGQTGTATKFTKTATATDLSSGNHCVGVRVRALGDGSDRIDLYVDGTTYSLTGQTIALDANFAVGNVGTIWLGGGFALAVTDTLKTTMANLPSNGGVWTYNGTATEANAFSVSGNVLYQNKNGNTSTQTADYLKSGISLSNGNGWRIKAMNNPQSVSNTKTETSCAMLIADGTKTCQFMWDEYFTEFYGGASASPIQVQLKGKFTAHSLQGKGSDAHHYANGRLIADYTGLLNAASALNKIDWADYSTTASENADAQWKYVAYYNTAWNPPQFTSGSISDFAIWQGDMSALWPLLYNGGSPVSVKALLGIERNYLDKSDKLLPIIQRGITSQPTTTSTTSALIPEMECFVVGEKIHSKADGPTRNDTLGDQVFLGIFVDGVLLGKENMAEAQVASRYAPNNVEENGNVNLGLHKTETRWRVTANTGSNNATNRKQIVETQP